MKAWLLFACVLFAACASPLDEMHARFRYRDDDGDHWCKAPPQGPWLGDCEDFAFSMQDKLGGDVWHVVLPDGRHHAALLVNGQVYDNLHRYSVPVARYKARWLFIMRPTPDDYCPAPK